MLYWLSGRSCNTACGALRRCHVTPTILAIAGAFCLMLMFAPMASAKYRGPIVRTLANNSDVIALVEVKSVSLVQKPKQYSYSLVTLTATEWLKGKQTTPTFVIQTVNRMEAGDYRKYRQGHRYLVFAVRKGTNYRTAYGRTGVFENIGHLIMGWPAPGEHAYPKSDILVEYQKVKKEVAGVLFPPGKLKAAHTGLPHVTHRLSIPFQILDRGALAIGIPEGTIPGDPMEAFVRLFLVNGKSALLVNDLNVLRGRVKVRTPKEALAFCRLMTSPVTFYLWDEGRVEVISSDLVHADFCFGDSQECASYKSLPSGYVGIVHSVKQLQSGGIAVPSVRETSEGFEVRRTLLDGSELDPRISYRIIVIRELVTRDGGYSVLSATEQPAPSIKGVTWLIPFFM